MKTYIAPEDKHWTGRSSAQQLYLHEKVNLVDLDQVELHPFEKALGIIGYACDEGVKRNLGRPGAAQAPDNIRRQLGKLPNHLPEQYALLDLGNVVCKDGNMENAQLQLGNTISDLLKQNIFPIALGGGHDIAYGHYNGIKKHYKNTTVGIVNFDAHFDLRSNHNGNNSGTPFFQISEDCKKKDNGIKYLCLGIREDANDRVLFKTAEELGVEYIKIDQFSISRIAEVKRSISAFIKNVDHVYITIDMDGFSSAYAPGVSAASPMGFSPDVVIETLQHVIASKKLISIDIAEMNPKYDLDERTAKLAASLIHSVMQKVTLL